MKFYIKYLGEIPMFLLVEREWNEAARRQIMKYYWVRFTSEATVFLSKADAWAAFDRSQTGMRANFDLETLA